MEVTTIMIIGGIVLAGIALWKGRKIFISKDTNGDYQVEISKLKDELSKLKSALNKKRKLEEVLNTLTGNIATKGMTMNKLRAIERKRK